MSRFVCIHGHFYQPPRENPWLEEVELQDSAYPYHDWNSRIAAESYAPNTASRILGSDHRIIEIVNNYSKISFNFGSALLTWMQRHEPETYQALLDADKKAQERFSGHGSALAQIYNHIIMPLANSRDKRTQIIWGIKDFQYRFQREPEGMWLAETAVDLETLDLLAECSIKFTILAQRQAKEIRKIGEKKWVDVSGAKIDPKMPYLCELPSGRKIIIFFYDGLISHEIAFGSLLESGKNFANKLVSAFSPDNKNTEIVHIATDGETYGHHHRYGDMALAYCLHYIESKNLAKITIYSEYLENYPPAYEVRVFENSSWSCVHGIERWRNNCGCNSGMHQEWVQDWRAPLRGAMDWLRDNLAHIYEEQVSKFLKDPWAARDAYIEVMLQRSKENTERFLNTHATRELNKEEKVKVIKLFEMQRHALLMYTSCGWFFDEISGIETVQVLQYAARAIQLAKSSSGISLEETFISLLEKAPSNIPEFQNGAGIYKMLVEPAMPEMLRIGVHYAISSIFIDYSEISSLYTYTAKSLAYERLDVGKQRLAIGRVFLQSNITWEEDEVSFAVLHLGDHNVVGAARSYQGQDLFLQMQQKIKKSFSKGDISEVIRIIDTHFSTHGFSLWHLFKDEQRKIISQIFKVARKETEASFRQIYERHQGFIQTLQNLNYPLPKYFTSTIGFVLNNDIRSLIESDPVDIARLKKLVAEARLLSGEIDNAALSLIASKRINARMEGFSKNLNDRKPMEEIITFIDAIGGLSLGLNLWKAQNIYFTIWKNNLNKMQEGEQKNPDEKAWFEDFKKLGNCLKVKVI